MARQGLPAKYAKMGFKKGWKAFRAAKRSGPKSNPRRVRKIKRKSKRRGNPGAGPVKQATRTTRRFVRAIPAIAIGSAIGVAGATGSAALIQALPIVDARAKALTQTGLGALAIVAAPKKLFGVRAQRPIRYAGIGAIIAGMLSLAKSVFPNMPLLSGFDRAYIGWMPQDTYQPALPSPVAPDSQSMYGRNVNYAQMAGVNVDYAEMGASPRDATGYGERFVTAADF